jgi:hypothetical protein
MKHLALSSRVIVKNLLIPVLGLDIATLISSYLNSIYLEFKEYDFKMIVLIDMQTKYTNFSVDFKNLNTIYFVIKPNDDNVYFKRSHDDFEQYIKLFLKQ